MCVWLLKQCGHDRLGRLVCCWQQEREQITCWPAAHDDYRPSRDKLRCIMRENGWQHAALAMQRCTDNLTTVEDVVSRMNPIPMFVEEPGR